jgi:hypothetical protein
MWNVPTVYDDHAHEAARSYLDHGQTLDTSIAKIASREGLTTEEIQRVVERSNQEVLDDLRSQPGDKNWEFDRATQEGVLGIMDPPKEADSGFIARDSHPVPGLSKAASAPREYDREDEPWRSSEIEKLAQVAEGVREMHLLDKEAEYAREDALRETTFHFLKIAQRMAVEEGYAFEDLARALADVRPKHADLARSLIDLARTRLGPTLTKVAAPAPVHLFRPSMSQGGRPVRIVNGEHALVMTFDTLVKQDCEHGTPAGPSADDTKTTALTAVQNLTGRLTSQVTP